MRAKSETMRRLRLGDVQKVLRQRYGHTLPDDDAGREDLRELLLPISLGQEAGRKMENAVQVWAPWMNAAEAGQLMDEINRSPVYLRKPTGRELGERLRLTYQERQAWGIRTIAPCDLTDDELLERRKARAAFRKWKRRQAAGTRTRAKYLASFAKSQNKQRPWEQEGISRSQWFARRAKTGPGVSAIKLNKQRTYPVQSQKEAVAKAS
jgi:hypothetical protein